MTEEFCAVTRKKWMARKNIQKRPRRISDKSYDPDFPLVVDIDKFLKRLENLCERMVTNDYFTQAMATLEQSLRELPRGGGDLKQLQRLVCFGIGPFTRNYQALHQLAFIVSTQRYCGITEAIYFDPIFIEAEKKVLQHLKCSLMTENCEAKYESDVKTLYYLPHCPSCLTNNLLWRNWRPQYLENTVLINNSFESLSLSKPDRILRLDSGYIMDVIAYAKEFPLEDDYETLNIFNDLSVHVFPTKEMPLEGEEFWSQRDAPTYKDVEMISADDFAKLSIE